MPCYYFFDFFSIRLSCYRYSLAMWLFCCINIHNWKADFVSGMIAGALCSILRYLNIMFFLDVYYPIVYFVVVNGDNSLYFVWRTYSFLPILENILICHSFFAVFISIIFYQRWCLFHFYTRGYFPWSFILLNILTHTTVFNKVG